MLTLAIVEDDPVCAAQLKENVERFCREYQIALQLKTLTQSLAGWISAGQCFLMEASGHPGGLVCFAVARAGRLPRRQQKKRRREGNGLHTAAPRHHMGPYTSPISGFVCALFLLSALLYFL